MVTNARILTMDAAHPRAEALAVRGEKIVAIGTVEQIKPYVGAQTRVIDAGGRLVIPGFNDSHAHFSSGAAGLRQLNLYGVSTLAEVQRLKTAAKGRLSLPPLLLPSPRRVDCMLLSYSVLCSRTMYEKEDLWAHHWSSKQWDWISRSARPTPSSDSISR